VILRWGSGIPPNSRIEKILICQICRGFKILVFAFSCWELLLLRFDIFVCHSCFAATIELMNGTFIGVKDCFRGDYCNSSSVCTNVTGGLPGISFKRCEASCCSQSSCNKYLPASWPPSPTVSATSSVSVNATQTPATKAKDTDPTAAGINVKAVYYLPICLLAVIQIMS